MKAYLKKSSGFFESRKTSKQRTSDYINEELETLKKLELCDAYLFI